MAYPVFLGLDFGTSGARACVIGPDEGIEEFAQVAYGAWRDHEVAGFWRETLWDLLAGLPAGLRKRLAGIAVDGTSGTVLACDEALNPLHPPLMYNDARALDEAALIARTAGPDEAAASPSSGLAKVLWLQRHLGAERGRVFVNQADWLTGLLTDRPGISDFHNALKMGYDLTTLSWPEWVGHLVDMDHLYLPRVFPPGAGVATLTRPRCRALGIGSDCLVRAGTTDSIAALLATGVRAPGEAVTSLGSTLVLKLVSSTRVQSREYGVYSHWFGDAWLAGGASNAGGAVLRQFFSDHELVQLSARIDPETDSGLAYYPLPGPGERFPIHDPALPPRLAPRPEEDAHFLHGLLDGLSAIEALGYRRLVELGADAPARVTTAGGGANNPVWRRIRERKLQLPVLRAEQSEAAFGAARLACHGSQVFPSRS